MANTRSILYGFSKFVLSLALIVFVHPAVGAQVWTVLAGDVKGDARDLSLADAAQLSYRYDQQQDYLWFRITLYGIPNEREFGVNIVFDTGADEGSKLNWWGANKTFRFDKLVTAWVTRTNNRYEGTIGVGDAAGVNARHLNNLLQNNLNIRVESDSLVIGVKRTDITDKLKMNVMAAVGSNERWNDDVPSAGGSTIDLSAQRPKRGLREIDLSRNNFEFPASYKTLPDNNMSAVTKTGRGRQPLILVPGMYSGRASFDEFITRNQSRYKFYVVTPPGILETPARSMPAAGSSFGELSWTRRLARDILELIHKEKLTKPVILTNGQPGSIAAFLLAVDNPEEVGGVVIAGTNLIQFFPSPKDPTRKKPATVEERVSAVDEGWGAKWFKYVTPETWESNDMRPEMLTSNVAKGVKAVQEIEAAPLPVKIRYLCEFWASDVTRSFDKLQVPVLALISGFDDKFLADPANSFAKTAYVDSWETVVPKHPNLELVKIADARLLILEDQPESAAAAIVSFIDKVSNKQK